MNSVATQVLHLSDLHFADDPTKPVFDELSDDNLDAVLEVATARHGQPDIVVATGDITDAASASGYLRAAERLRAAAPKAFWVPGNHDRAALMSDLAPDRFPARVMTGAWDVILLDSAWAGHDEGRLGDRQLTWLDEVLTETPKHVAVFLHHPPLPVCGELPCSLFDADAFLAVLERHANVRAVLTGHSHRPFDQRRGHVRFLGAPSTCRQADHGVRHAWTNEGPAARWVSLATDGTVDEELVWLATAPAELELSYWP